ncbi:adhesion G protein-coupled receptor E5 isoform X2 [Hyla sarda]|uniref:adhesion G protein-coupled receptor E5 isoform X2 n=1 Tax=Hyla sarda TaxID=327740 RepID=UPI0024C26E7D|nr:adhesion G protein-coupled receptor E5 isoform X2 [Hyla sarda]
MTTRQCLEDIQTGITIMSNNISPTTGVSASMINKPLLCPNGTKPPDINECRKRTDLCHFYTQCKNSQVGYYCKCDEGFQKENKTEFCPSVNRSENTCTDIDECSDSPRVCGSNLICRNLPGSYKCVCNEGFTKVSDTCLEIVRCHRNKNSCGLKGICVSNQISITCSCQDGYRAVSLGLPHPQCNVKCKNNATRKECHHDPIECKLKDFTNNFTPYCKNDTTQDELSLEKLLEGLDGLIDGFSYVNKSDRLQKAGNILKTVELTVQNLVLLKQKALSLTNKKKTISIEVAHGTADSGTLSLQGSKSSVTLDSKTAAGNTGVALLGCIEYTNITHIFEEADLLEEISKNKTFKLVSPVISVFLGITNTSSLRQPVSMRLNVKEEMSKKMSCVSWSVSDNSWSNKGCETGRDEYGVTCNCTHLTSFAVLMLLHDDEEVLQSVPLTLITQIGLSISIFCLVLAIITFCFCRSLRGTRNTIHMHLCISLFFGNCIFLLGITAVNSKVCGIVAGLLHAFYLSSFCWMSLEGLELYLMLVTVFNTHLKKRYLLAVGYGIPAVIITISAAIYHEGYGTKKYCWLSHKQGFIWAFMGPVCAIILVNCGIFVLTVWKLAEKMSSVSPEQGKLRRFRTLTVTSLAQLCILGSCWAFGFFMFSSATLFFAYAFTILNTLQGIQIFCLHCLMHKKVRAEYKIWLCALAHFKSPVYSEFSNTSNTQTHSKGKTGKDSGL